MSKLVSKKRSFRLQTLETLESRNLLTVSVALTGDSITVGTNGDGGGYSDEFASLVAASPHVSSSTGIGAGGLNASCYMGIFSCAPNNQAQNVVDANTDVIVYMLGTNDSSNPNPVSADYLFNLYQTQIGTKVDSAFNLFGVPRCSACESTRWE